MNEKGAHIAAPATAPQRKITGNQKDLCTTILQQTVVVLISVLIYWWQASNIENGVPIPTVAREACAILGVKQHWKLFTNLTSNSDSGGGGNLDCRIVLIGALKGSVDNKPKPDNSASVQPFHYVNLLQWKNTKYSNHLLLYPSVEKVLRNHSTGDRVEGLWSRWTIASRSNDYAMMSTGDYFCRVWNRKRRVQMTVTMDGENVPIVYGLETKTVINAAERFCAKYRLLNDQCQQLYERMKETSDRERLDHYYYLSICEEGYVHGIKQQCSRKDQLLSYETDTREFPVVIAQQFENLQ